MYSVEREILNIQNLIKYSVEREIGAEILER